MSVHLKGDKPINDTINSKSKALRINLNQNVYGTFSEIGAGQETVRHFFRAGGASGTIAKAMSAYDKDFSDAIYGKEKDLRYVSQDRLVKMLSHEMKNMQDRLDRKNHPEKIFFSYANTVTTIDFAKKFKGHGWVGIRFQLDPLEAYNEIILHLRFKEIDAKLQQETLGILGVNLIYGAFYMHDNPKELLNSLYDNLLKTQLEIDFINFSGPRFTYVDNRMMSLELIKQGMTQGIMFDSNSENVLPANILYKKNILTLRGRFKPVTNTHLDMFRSARELFFKNSKINNDNTEVIFEISLSDLKQSNYHINERDFLDRAALLCSMNENILVMITKFQENYKFLKYLNEFTSSQIGLVVGAENLTQLFDSKYYKDLEGGILEAFGKLFTKNTYIYIYPAKKQDNIIDSNTIKVNNKTKEIYKFFKYNNRLVDILKYNKNCLDIDSDEIITMIANNSENWEKMVPKNVANLIKTKQLLGYKKTNDK